MPAWAWTGFALGNSGDPGAVAPLARALNEDVALVRGHCAWALGQLGGGMALSALQAAAAAEQKAAEIFVGAAAMGGPNFLTAKDVDRIANRIDEHHRQRALNL